MASEQEEEETVAEIQTLTSIHEARFEEMVTPSHLKTTLRLANFLNPLSKNPHKASHNFLPKTPLLSEIFSHDLHQWPSKVTFRGWYGPLKKWKQWVDMLSPKYSPIWKQTGIHQAILTSVNEIRQNPDIVLGLSEFWCSETNTFLFPWGEATITLEDIMTLGGYPVLGDPVLPGKMGKLEEYFKNYRVKVAKNSGVRNVHHGWLQYFMEDKRESRGDLLHITFLSLWLSRFVFPTNADECILNSIIPLAVKLSRGFKFTLGPAVLASLYHDLTIIKEEALASRDKINVFGPFQLLQIWVFERFPILGPKPADLLLGLPRMDRWNKMSLKLTLPLVRVVVMEAKNFCWRPYAAKLKNWRYPSNCKEKEQLFSDCSNLDDELRSFHRSLLATEVVGMDCKEKYFPHRVAMQFGLDQDIPAHLSSISLGSREPSQLFVPSRFSQPCVTLGYSKWWKHLMLTRQGKFKDVSLGKNGDTNNGHQVISSVEASGNSQDNHAIDTARYPFDSDSDSDSESESESSMDTSFQNNHRKVPPKVPFDSDSESQSQSESSMDSSFQNNPIKVPSKVPFEDKTPTVLKGSSSTTSRPIGSLRLHPEDLKRLFYSEGWKKAGAGRFQTDYPTTHTVLKGSSSPISPPTTIPRLPSEGRKRLFEVLDNEGQGPASLPCDKRAKIAKTGKELPVSMQAERCQAGLPNVNLDKKYSRKEKSPTRKYLKISETRKTFKHSSEVNAGEKMEPVKRAGKDVCDFTTEAGGFCIEIKVEPGNSANEPFNIGFNVKRGKDSSNEHKTSVAKGGEKKMAREFASSPINLDEDTPSACNGTQDILERLLNLEKMMGVVKE